MTTPFGSFIWYEYMTTDLQAAGKFYAEVVGWATSDAGMVDFPYTLVSVGQDMVGGLLPMPEAARQMGARPGWLGYVGVPDVDAYAAKLAAAGGAVYRPPSDIPRVGRFSVVADPHGASFALFKGEPPEDPRPPMARDALGNVGWRELRAGDLASAFAFYSGLFGWKQVHAMDMGAMGVYQVFAMQDGQSGGMMTKAAQMPAPYWLYYFNVEAIDAAADRIRSAGGEIVVPPHEVPGGGWVVHARDPEGAAFALLSGNR